MPLYEYECTKCSHVFDVLQKVGEGAETLICPKCGGMRLKKLVTGFRLHSWSEFIDKMERKISPEKFK
jgi:putative FmdB family regulatory protein